MSSALRFPFFLTFQRQADTLQLHSAILDQIDQSARGWIKATGTRTGAGQGAERGEATTARGVAHSDSRSNDPGAAAGICQRLFAGNIETMLGSVTEWSFDIFALAECTGGKPLEALGYHVFDLTGLTKEFQLNCTLLDRFLAHINENYCDSIISDGPSHNPYHNAAHAADVLQAVYVMASQEMIREVLKPDELLALVIAAAVHDFRHKGVSNGFLQRQLDDIALVHNDDSALERYHVSEAFKYLYKHCNFLGGLSADMFQRVRHGIIQLVLATDLEKSGHYKAMFDAYVSLVHEDPLRPPGGDPGAAMAGAGGSGVAVPGPQRRRGKSFKQRLFRGGSKRAGMPTSSMSMKVASTPSPSPQGGRRTLSPEAHFTKPRERLLLMQMLLKVADISHPARNLDSHLECPSGFYSPPFLFTTVYRIYHSIILYYTMELNSHCRKYSVQSTYRMAYVDREQTHPAGVLSPRRH